MAFLLWHIHLLAFRAVYFDSGGAYLLTHSDGESGLAIAQHSWANSKRSLDEFFSHYGQALRSDYVSRVDEAVDIRSLLIDREVAE